MEFIRSHAQRYERRSGKRRMPAILVVSCISPGLSASMPSCIRDGPEIDGQLGQRCRLHVQVLLDCRGELGHVRINPIAG